MTEQVLDSDLHLNCAAATQYSESRQTRGWQAGDLVADLELRRLQIGGARIAVQEVPFRLLCLLLERGGRPVSRRELHESLWPRQGWDSFERNVNTAIRKLRRAIGDDAREPRLIETLRASGYRWIGPSPIALASLPAEPVASTIDPVRPGRDHEPGATTLAAPACAATARRGVGRWFWTAAAAVMLLGGVLLAAAPRPAPERPWIVVEPADAAGSVAVSKSASELAASLRGMLASPAANDAGEPVRVALAIRNGKPAVATVSGRGAAAHFDLDEKAYARERLLAEVAARLPAAALKPADTPLPPPAAKAYADAGTLLVGARNAAAVERALALVESVLSVAPDHVGALRTYARAQRALALLNRVPEAARERRLLAHDALRRAVAADPRSAGVAQDVAGQLFWGEWNAAAAADWFALARRAEPRSPELLRAYAWFALGDDRIDEAMAAMNAALAAAPLDVALHSDLGWFWFRTGRYDDALRQCRIALETASTDSSAQTCEERALAELGRPDEAWRALRRHAPEWLDARNARELDALEPGNAYRAAMHLAAQRTRERIGAGYDSACLEAIAGNREAAEADLAAATALADPGLHMARVTPELRRLLGDAAVRRLAGDEQRPLAAVDIP